MKKTAYILLSCWLAIACSSQKSEKDCLDSQWRGPERSGVYSGVDLLKEWPENGPELKFAVDDLGRSHSAAVVSDKVIFATGMKDSMEYLSALDLDGNILWQKSYGARWEGTFPEARCTPLVENDRVYVLTGKDKMACLNAVTGDLLWEVDIHAVYSSVPDMFGVSESLLMVDDKIICTPGGNETTVIALDKMTGELVWKTESLGEARSNGSPIHVVNKELGFNLIIAMCQNHVLGVDPANGEILWKHYHNKLDENGNKMTFLTNTPLVYNDEIFISHGWQVPAEMLKLVEGGSSVSVKYSNDIFDNQNHGMVRLGDYVYGSNFVEKYFGKWVCMRWSDGKIMYEEEWHNKGPVISADGMLYLVDEAKGNVGLAAPTPDSLHIISSFKVSEGNGPFWSRPTIYHGMLFIRHGDVLLAYNIKG